MKLSIQDFRCFHAVHGIDVRPINLLVGENSAGKSSLLAAIRFLFEFSRRDAKASFNKDPFFLGSYDQIAHYRGGRFGRAKEFSFCLTDKLNRDNLVRRLRSIPQEQENLRFPDRFEFQVRFSNNRSQPAMSHISFKADRFAVEAKIGEGADIILKTPNLTVRLPREKIGRSSIDAFYYDMSYLDFAIRDARFVTQEEKVSKEALRELDALFEIYRLATRTFPPQVYASAPVRSKPERTYNPGEASPSPGGDHIPFVLAQIKSFEREEWADIIDRLEGFGRASGLFESINIRQLGNTEGGPFQLVVDLEGSRSNIIDVGYGVSQVLPIVTELIRGRPRTAFLFQQPEVHLHPRAQAELASFFCKVVSDRKHTLFVETHSDNLIDRFRMEAREGRVVKPSDISILFFERVGLDVSVHQITLDDLGNLHGAPPNYRKFFIDEEFRSLGAAT